MRLHPATCSLCKPTKRYRRRNSRFGQRLKRELRVEVQPCLIKLREPRL
ncbi:MAG: hypothetical protein HY352_05820 [Candidatus Omnitrophica bacterium]|nr:hypothetical protein [Candidatus Omnitrophota bacterium]